MNGFDLHSFDESRYAPSPLSPLLTVPILFYDGDCGLCHRSIRFILQHERTDLDSAQQLRLAPLQSRLARALLSRTLCNLDSKQASMVLWHPQYGIRTHWEAVLATAHQLRWLYRWLALWGRLFPRVVGQYIYLGIARRRHRWTKDSCFVPSPGQQARFIYPHPTHVLSQEPAKATSETQISA